MPPNVSRLPTPRKLLLARPDRLGDVVITTSCLDELKRQLPDTALYFAARKPYCFMIAGHPALAGVLPLEDAIDPESLAAELKTLAPDTFINLNPEIPLETAAELAGIPVRIGYSRKKGERLTVWLPYQWKKVGSQHEAYYNFDLLELYGVQAPGKLKPWIQVPEEAVTKARELLDDRPIALIHLASYGNKPRVPAPFFASIAARLYEEQGVVSVIVGARDDDHDIVEFLECLGPLSTRVLNLAGKTSVEELAGLSKVARLMVSRDSGPAHLAAAIGCPTLTFFINPTPLMSTTRWAPLGRNVRIYTKPIITLPYEPPHRLARRTVKHFKADEAYALARELVDRYVPL